MVFANGLKKAGTFKDNVLMDLLTSPETIEVHERETGQPLPPALKKELTKFIQELNPGEDQTHYLKKELKANQVEEKTQPNTLLLMQEADNAPWGGKSGLTRDMFV
jgi:hypothetical protein